jgi:hypothetical protein
MGKFPLRSFAAPGYVDYSCVDHEVNHWRCPLDEEAAARLGLRDALGYGYLYDLDNRVTRYLQSIRNLER